MKFKRLMKIALMISVFSSSVAIADDSDLKIKPSIIAYGDFKQEDLKPLPKRLYRVLIGKDFPPFNYRNKAGKITGFNVEIATEVCQSLNIKCQIIAKNWRSIAQDLQNDKADFAVASMNISKKNLRRFELSNKYYHLPTRFIVRQDHSGDGFNNQALAGKNIGVVANSAHEAYLLSYMKSANIYPYKDLDEALTALKDKKVMAVFSDALRAKYWLNAKQAEDCCKYAKGDYYDMRFFGDGAAIALTKGDTHIKHWINIALKDIWSTGRYEEIFNKYISQ